MAHKIAMSNDVNGDLWIVYLDAAGTPWAFHQLQGGVWQPKVQLPIPAEATGFSAIVGLGGLGYENNIFIAVAISPDGLPGALYYIVPTAGGGWTEFALLTTQPYTGVTDFSAVWIPESFLLVAAVVGPTVNVLFGTPGSIGPLAGEATFVETFDQPTFPNNCISVTYRGNGSGVILFTTGTTALNCWIDTQGNGVGWLPAPIAPLQWAPRANIISVVGVQGNPSPTIQALLLVRPPGANQPQGSGTPYLLWNVSQVTEAEQIQINQGGVPDTVFGQAWQDYGTLPNNTAPVVLPWSAVAAALGAQDRLQVVGIGLYLGSRYPYLIWQDQQGNWNGYNNGVVNDTILSGALPNNSAIPTTWTQVSDLAIGMGSSGSAPALQVGYLGTDGNVYINWQDDNGNWYWYGGQSGSGLP